MTLRVTRSRSRSGSSTELLRNAANGSSRILTDPSSLHDASETPKLYSSNNVMNTNPPPTANNLDNLNPHNEMDVKINLNNLPGKKKRERPPLNKDGSEQLPTCIYFSPSSRGIHLWCGIISLVVVYHMWVIVYRYSFAEICQHNLWIWFLLDYLADFLYLVDMAISVRTGFLEDGVMQFNDKRMRVHYMNSTQFYIDCLSLLPLDFLYLSIGYNSMLRVFRLCKVYKFWQFLDRAERHASWPNIMRFAKLMFYYLTILHWNACAFKLVADFMMHRPNPISLVPLTENHIIHTQQTEFDRSNFTVFATNNSGLTYVSAVYWGMLSLISVGTPQPTANEPVAYMFKIIEGIVGVLLFAAILGHVSNIITNASAGQKEFQGKPYFLKDDSYSW
ncbi:hypothetical protein PHET_00191 [Paragonimus heterotremus]|uniref:Ion transport domain-containing protein n=1 Tax=Paragonimus heterotremus TaxID=100268 RepID=A0A8J4WVD8_9TREM|nr:hypothetical protein PHET_00191 [Paragonimus heterotremus]